MEEEEKISFIFTPPSFGKKNELCSLNNLSRWYRFAKTKIKQDFKAELGEWYLPQWEDNPYTKAEIEYTILRKDGKKLDSDNLTIIYKWLQDLLVEQGYMVDDDSIRVILNPTQLHVEGSIETSVRVAITLKRKFIMTVEELKLTVGVLQSELERVGGEDHVKTASGRVRKILGEIKNATPDLRRTLIELDKK